MPAAWQASSTELKARTQDRSSSGKRPSGPQSKPDAKAAGPADAPTVRAPDIRQGTQELSVRGGTSVSKKVQQQLGGRGQHESAQPKLGEHDARSSANVRRAAVPVHIADVRRRSSKQMVSIDRPRPDQVQSAAKPVERGAADGRRRFANAAGRPSGYTIRALSEERR